MFKRMLIAMLPMVLVSVSVKADDNDLNIDVASITDADVNVVEVGLDIDVDLLTADAGTEGAEDAVEACFRRAGYRCGGWGYGFGHGGWNSCHRPYFHNWNCYRPCYAVPQYYCVQPQYHTCYVASPVYTHYWGCY